jgi:Holliday junction resolvase RusA-like endonuclease
MIAFRLPFPPSANMMFVNSKNKTGKGRFPSADYKTWKKAAGLMMNTQQHEAQEFPFSERVCIEIQLNEKYVRANADCDNRVKPVLDLLVDQGMLKGDSMKYVRGCGVEWRTDLNDVYCMVLIYPESEIDY